MLFTDYLFFPFLAACVLGNIACARWPKAQQLFLLLASWSLFLLWGIADFFLFLSALILNYFLVRALVRTERPLSRLWWLRTIIFGDLILLATFKYKQFILVDVLHLATVEQAGTVLGSVDWVPLAISFYTFHMISYAIDMYKESYSFTSPLPYATYISFFPHLIAGPIVRGNQLIPQITEPWTTRRIDWVEGVYRFSLGIFFKALADQLASVIDPYFSLNDPSSISFVGHWLLALLFSARIFTDFAGYSLMAMGVASMLGYQLPLNFNAPYIATTFQAFWRRWHITLSSFLRDYLYVLALGGNRRGKIVSALNLAVTMLLGGLWHGAAWTFVIWGGIHGAALMVERMLHLSGSRRHSPAITIGWYVIVQVTVLIAWVFFRAPTLGYAAAFVAQMADFRLARPVEPTLLAGLVLAAPALVHHLSSATGTSQRLLAHAPLRGALAGGLLIGALLLLGKPAAFIYFTF